MKFLLISRKRCKHKIIVSCLFQTDKMAGRYSIVSQNAYSRLLSEYRTKLQEEKFPVKEEPQETNTTTTQPQQPEERTNAEKEELEPEVEIKSKLIVCINASCRKRTKDSCIRR